MDIQPNFTIVGPEHPPQRAKVSPVPPQDSSAAERVERVPAPQLRSTQSEDVLNSARKFQRQTGYDQPEGKGRNAVDAYQSLERESQRDNIRQLLGVDIFA